ncbi:hypothetical protein Rvan_2818 [Rhodomicrobium vannielii ATCC 17100]|uniref:SMODS and SLOG-associating 2TM effector domain-containing protein n=1 Tax=Rhodomicrobium vannielii (strain ATCC 17100 / DSM 162 / LMG 4299 / NCIMB 10020 / ATH 3.1.1) TaxID=648757 RepID=E3I8P8_RHOVT|nr:hypothetical protein [Rhodomicrobium vannielii]ADP72027.1 hypothetical protein Rvan_2818 [Rhodomicrobium vannielii ATCC 17100]
MLDLQTEAALKSASDAAGFSGWEGRIPIVLGGIGHRELGDLERIAGLVRKECAALKERYPHSPFVILSPLAEGADRLIARVVMDELGANLIAVLPMPPEDYKNDFPSEASKAEFDDLLAKALCVKLALTPDDPAWKQPGPKRDEQYARAGAIIADHAQVLFAIWNRLPAKGVGGTADQVKWFDRGFAPAAYSLYNGQISPLDPPEPGLRIGIDPVSFDVELVENPLSGSTDANPKRSNIRAIMHRTERYNCDVVSHRAAIAASKPIAVLSKGAVAESRLADSVFQAADGMSAHFATIARFSDKVVYALAIVAIVSFNFMNVSAYAVWLYLGVTLLMLALYLRIRWRSIDNRFLEYRSLAEALRVFCFWRHAGVKRSVWLSFLSRQAGIVHWLRHATRTVEFCQDSVATAHTVTQQNLADVKKHWVQDQVDWFATRIPQHEGRRMGLRTLWRTAIGLSFVLSFALLLMTFTPAALFFGSSAEADVSLWKKLVEPEPYGNLWQAVLSFLAAGGLAARGFSQRRGDAELAKQYASQQQIFKTANDMLDKVGQPDAEWKPEEILRTLGKEALEEQAEFVWLRHARPFEMPQ